MVIADMRKLIRQDQRIIQRLHRRVFLDKITKEDITIYISFYVEVHKPTPPPFLIPNQIVETETPWARAPQHLPSLSPMEFAIQRNIIGK